MISARQRATRLDYRQSLLSSQVNYALTHFADHSQQYSHDQLNRYLRDDKLTPPLVWEQVKGSLVMSPDTYLLFDYTVADKIYSRDIEVVRRQYSGNAKSVIGGIGIVTRVYVNPETAQSCILGYRIFDPDRDGKTKLDHVRQMLDHTMQHKQLTFRCALIDAW